MFKQIFLILSVMLFFVLSLIVFISCPFTTLTIDNENKEEEIPTYNIIYNGNGNTSGSVPIDDNDYKEGEPVKVLGNTGNLIKNGYIFAGWNTTADGNDTNYHGGYTFIMPAGDVTLYAQWEDNPSTYNVTYDGNGADGGEVPVDSNEYSAGQTVTVVEAGTMTCTDHTFACWNTIADGSGTYYSVGESFIMPASNITLYARWSDGSTYNVIYDGNGADGGEVPVDNNNYIEGQTVTVVAAGTMTCTGFTFVGWNTAANGSGMAYIGGDTFHIPTSNVTLYAQWAPTYNVLYNSNGADGGDVPVDSNN